MHGVLAVIHLVQVLGIEDNFVSFFMSLQLISVLLEMWNLCKMLDLYAVSIITGHDFSEDSRAFQFWILIEIIVLFCTLINTIIYLFWRSMKRDSVQIKYADTIVDTTEDFMSSNLRLVYLTFLLTTTAPLIGSTILLLVFVTDNAEDAKIDVFETSSESLDMFKI